MNIMKKSIVILMIFTLLMSISLISRAENIIEDNIPDINNMDIDTEDSIDDSLEDILSKHGITNELDQIQEEILVGDGNYFRASQKSFTLNSNIDGDAFILCGGKLTIDTYISGNAFICAKEVEITNNAQINSSLFCVAKDLTIAGGVNLNAYCASNNFNITEDAFIYKNLYISAQNIDLNGLIENNALISGNSITINPNCIIKGNLHYSAPKEIEIPEDVVEGTTYFSTNSVDINSKDATKLAIKHTIYTIVSYIIFAIIVFLILNALKAKLINNSDNFKSNIGKYILFGLLILFVEPILTIIAFIIPFLSRFAFVLLGLYILLLMVASAITIITLSKLCADKFKDTIKTNDILRTILFIILFSIGYKLLKLVPILGSIITFATVILGIGIFIKNLLPAKETNQ